jgi:signal transduction histidine kinase
LTPDLAPLPGITCSPTKINQVVLNLVANAIDACHAGGKVTIRSRTTRSGIEVEISDNGSGIDPIVRDKIFDPFFTTKPQGQGTGLGLSISHGIVADHGGTITVESAIGKGTTFIVRLPLVAPPATDRQKESSSGR